MSCGFLNANEIKNGCLGIIYNFRFVQMEFCKDCVHISTLEEIKDSKKIIVGIFQYLTSG